MDLADVSTTLWRERHLLDLLHYKLDVSNLLLSAGVSRWVTAADDEVHRVIEEIRHTEVIRAVQVDAVAASLGLRPNPSLGELAAAVEEPWRSILLEHREALLLVTEEIRARSEANRNLLKRGADALREISTHLTGQPASDGYPNRSGRPSSASSLLVDRAL